MRHLIKPALHRLVAFAALALSVAAGGSAQAEYPEKPVLLIVGSGAGGVNDIIARIYAEHMTKTMGQQVLVENRPGAGTTIAVSAVMKAAPDGYTMLVNGSSHGVISALYPQSGIDVVRDLDSVSMMAVVPLILAIHKSVPGDDYKSFVSYLKANPDKLSFGTNGAGSGAHLAGELFKRMADVSFVHVPYRTTPQALNDMLSGQIGLMIDTHTLLGPHIKAGTLKGIAATTVKRSSILPDLPTFDEMGLRGYDASSWTSMYAPKGTPKAIVDRLNRAIEAALADKAVIDRFEQLGIIGPTATGPEHLTAYLKQDIKKWSEILASVKK